MRKTEGSRGGEKMVSDQEFCAQWEKFLVRGNVGKNSTRLTFHQPKWHLVCVFVGLWGWVGGGFVFGFWFEFCLQMGEIDDVWERPSHKHSGDRRKQHGIWETL